jgi:hypothetical protein
MFFVFPSVYIYIITNILHDSLLDHIGGVLASSTVDCWSPDQVKSKTIKLVFVASPLSMQPKGERAKWFSPGSSTNKTDLHDITEILLKVAFNTIKPNQTIN